MALNKRSLAAALAACMIVISSLGVWADTAPEPDEPVITAATSAEIDAAIVAAQRGEGTDVFLANRSVTAAQIERVREFFPEGRLILDQLFKNGSIFSRTYIDLDYKMEVFDGDFFDHFDSLAFTTGFTPGGSADNTLARDTAEMFDHWFVNDIVYTFALNHVGETPGRVHTTAYPGEAIEAPLYGYMYYPADNYYEPIHCYLDDVGCIHVEYTESGGVLVFSGSMLQRK